MSVSSTAATGQTSYPPLIDRLFARKDQDGDGKLSLSEFSATGQNVPAGQASDGTNSPTDLFNSIDTNGDGSITKDELSAFQKQQIANMQAAFLSLQEVFGNQNGPGGARQWHRLHHHHHGAGNDQNAQSQSGASGQQPQDLSQLASQMVQKIDTSGDGMISTDELASFLQSRNAS